MDSIILKKNIKRIEDNINLQPIFGKNNITDEYEIINIIFINDNWITGGGKFLANALVEIRKIYPTTRLIIAGTTPAEFIDNSIIIDDYNSGELEKYINKNSIFCVPYLIESLGMPIIDAMRRSLPIITTKNTFTAQYITNEKNGIFVNVFNEMQLTAMLIKLISNKKLRLELGENAFKSIISNYHISHYSNTNKIYY